MEVVVKSSSVLPCVSTVALVMSGEITVVVLLMSGEFIIVVLVSDIDDNGGYKRIM